MKHKHGTGLYVLWKHVANSEQGISFTGLVEQGFHANLISRAIADGVLLHAKKTLPCTGCGRPTRLLHAAKNPVVMHFDAIKRISAEKLIAAGEPLYVRPTELGFDVYPYAAPRTWVVSDALTADEVVAWAAKQQR